MISHSVLDLPLVEGAVGIVVANTGVQIEVQELIRWHWRRLVTQLGLHIPVIPRSSDIVMPANDPVDGIADQVDVDGLWQMESGKVDVGYMLAVDVWLLTGQEVSNEIVLSLLVHQDGFVGTALVPGVGKSIDFSQSGHQFHQRLAAHLRDAIEEHEVRLGELGVIQQVGLKVETVLLLPLVLSLIQVIVIIVLIVHIHNLWPVFWYSQLLVMRGLVTGFRMAIALVMDMMVVIVVIVMMSICRINPNFLLAAPPIVDIVSDSLHGQ